MALGGNWYERFLSRLGEISNIGTKAEKTMGRGFERASNKIVNIRSTRDMPRVNGGGPLSGNSLSPAESIEAGVSNMSKADYDRMKEYFLNKNKGSV